MTEKIALFYYFTFLDESKAQAATIKTIKQIRQSHVVKKTSTDELVQSEAQTQLVKYTNEFIRKTGGEIKPSSLSFSAGQVIIPENSNWGPWFEFRKIADENDFRTLLYAKILEISEASIAEGMEVPL